MSGIERWEEADPSEHLPDPDGDTTEEAVFIGQQVVGDTLIIGNEDKDEWLSTKDMGPLDVVDFR